MNPLCKAGHGRVSGHDQFRENEHLHAGRHRATDRTLDQSTVTSEITNGRIERGKASFKGGSYASVTQGRQPVQQRRGAPAGRISLKSPALAWPRCTTVGDVPTRSPQMEKHAVGPLHRIDAAYRRFGARSPVDVRSRIAFRSIARSATSRLSVSR